MSGGYYGNPFNVYDPVGYNPLFGQAVTGANFGFSPAPQMFTPFGMPSYFGMPDYMYNRGSYMDQQQMLPQPFNPFGNFNQPMMQPPQSPSQLGIGEPAPEFTPMQSNIYQPPVQTVTPVEDRPPAFTPYTKWTSISELGMKVDPRSNKMFRDVVSGYTRSGEPIYTRETKARIPGTGSGHYMNPARYSYGTMPINF